MFFFISEASLFVLEASFLYTTVAASLVVGQPAFLMAVYLGTSSTW